ncbi:MAG: acyltransferase [Alteromonadaceae bacterium]|nr:acyltransferase [Alteromonadaceae bacterium]
MQTQFPYVPAIDGLRAIAVLAVMAFHLDPAFLPGGFAGVDVFFVISGYVVARSLIGRADESFGRFLLGFYSRRVRRIVPALIVCVLATSLLTVLFIPDSWLSSTTSQVGLFAFFGLSNLALVWFQDDYFSPRTDFNPFVHTWSLGVEEQFYFVFPLLIFIWFRWFRKPSAMPAGALINSLIPILAVISLYIAYHMGQQRPDWAYYMLPARFWELAAGVVLFQLQARQKLPTLSTSLASLCLLAGIILMAAGFIWADKNAFPYPWAVLPVAGTVLALWAVSGTEGRPLPLASVFTTTVAITIGKLSYSLYLWHWPVYTLMRWTTGLHTPALMGTAIALTFILAAVSYHFIETPVRRARPLAQPAWRAVAVGGVAITLFWASANTLFENRADLTLSTTGQTDLWYPYTYPDAPEYYPVTGKPEAAPALTGRQMFVTGNSHTGAYTTMVKLLEQRHGITTHLHQTGHCALGNMLYPIEPLAGCETTADDYLSFLKEQANPGDMVFLASLRTHRLSDQWYRKPPEQVLAHSQSQAALADVQAAREEAKQLVNALEDMGLIVLLDYPKPVLKAPPYRCSDWFNGGNPICTGDLGTARSFMDQLRAPVVRSMQQLRATASNVYLWDPMPALCTGHQCAPFDKTGRPLFFDGDHLSAHGNRVLYSGFEERVLSAYAACDTCPPAPGTVIPDFDSTVQKGERVTFEAGSQGQQYLGKGWSNPEHWGNWTAGNTATLYLPLANGDVRSLKVEAHPLISDSHLRQRINATMNGIPAGSVTLNEDSGPDFELKVPQAAQRALKENKVLVLELELPNATSPAQAGINGDPRVLALGLTAVTLE